MHNPQLVKNFVASGDVAAYRVVKISAQGTVAQASAASDPLIGITDRLAATSGERCDVILSGVAEAQAGGTITIGDYLTVDANGKVIVASRGGTFSAGAFPTLADGALSGGTLPSLTGGVGDRLIGLALESASAGDIIPVLIDRA